MCIAALAGACIQTFGCSKESAEPARHPSPPVAAAQLGPSPAVEQPTSGEVGAERDTLSPGSFPNARLYAFECENGKQLFVRTDGGFAYLTSENYEALPRVTGDPNQTYELGDARVSIDGDFAIMRLADGQELNCANNAELAAFEAARHRGVTFRGIGPQLLLEIDDANVRVVTDGGAGWLGFPKSEPSVRGGQTTYRGSAQQKDVTVTITDGACHDAQSKQDFDERVRVQVGESTYEGCGRSLE